MSYVENNLLDNERVYFLGRLHWKIYIVPGIVSLIGLYMFANDVQAILNQEGTTGYGVPVFFLGLV